jgi:hypothetical protein
MFHFSPVESLAEEEGEENAIETMILMGDECREEHLKCRARSRKKQL